jgi:hypothetical protein
VLGRRTEREVQDTLLNVCDGVQKDFDVVQEMWLKVI